MKEWDFRRSLTVSISVRYGPQRSFDAEPHEEREQSQDASSGIVGEINVSTDKRKLPLQPDTSIFP